MSDRTNTAEQARNELTDRLTRVRGKHALFSSLTGASNLLSGVTVFSVLLIAIESTAYLTPAQKTIALLIAGCLILIGLGWFVIRPQIARPDLLKVAHVVETSTPSLHPHLVNAVQLWSQKGSPGVSSDLIDAALVQAQEATSHHDLGSSIDPHRLLSAARRFGLSLVVTLLVLQLLPGAGMEAVARLGDPAGRYVRPLETQMTVSPGDTSVIAGDSLLLSAQLDGVVPLDAELELLEEDGDSWSSEQISVREGNASRLFSTVQASLTYRWRAHDAVSNPFFVLARPRPVVLSLETEYRYPDYTNLPNRVDREGGDLVGLAGTDVILRAKTSRRLAEAWLDFDDGSRVTANVVDDSLIVGLSIRTVARFTIGLRDTAGIRNANPVTYRILPLEDEPPQIVVLRPGRDSELGEQMVVPLMFEAVDDFGISRVDIVYEINRDGTGRTIPIQLDTPGKPELAQGMVWDLSEMDLLPGDEVVYRLRAYDINTIDGPGMGETPEYVVRFPSLQEIAEAARKAQEQTIEQLEEVADESRRLREEVADVSREIAKKDEASWEDRTRIQEAMQQQEELHRKIDEGMRSLDETRQRLEQSGLLSPETLEKIQQVRELMSSLRSPELDRITQELEKGVEQVDPEMIRDAIDRLTKEQEAFQENLDRTIALLERVREEQMLDGITARLRDLAEDQREISDALREGQTPESQSERQRAQTRESDQFSRALEEAAESITTPEDRLGQLSEQFEKNRIPDRSDQVARDMRAGQQDRSTRGSDQLSSDLDQMADELKQIRDAHRSQQRDELLRQLAGVFRDMLNLSRSQERTAESATQSERGVEQERLGERQTRDLNAAGRLQQRIAEASQQTFLVPPQATTGLRNAMQQMQESLGQLQRGQGTQAGRKAREAMAGLNGAASAIRSAMAAIREAGSPTGMDEMLEQLAQASDRQGDLNSQTEGMMGQPRPGGQQGGNLPQLSAEQEAIRQMLNEIRDKFGAQEGQTLGDLGKISEEMEDVARQLRRNQLDSRTVDRQRRILSRMLDAQKSIRQRGFSNDREARAGEDLAYRGPGSLPSSLGERGNPLRDRLRDALRQGYPDEYQTLIRRYFDRLIEDAASGSAKQ